MEVTSNSISSRQSSKSPGVPRCRSWRCRSVRRDSEAVLRGSCHPLRGYFLCVGVWARAQTGGGEKRLFCFRDGDLPPQRVLPKRQRSGPGSGECSERAIQPHPPVIPERVHRKDPGCMSTGRGCTLKHPHPQSDFIYFLMCESGKKRGLILFKKVAVCSSTPSRCLRFNTSLSVGGLPLNKKNTLCDFTRVR